MSRVAALLAVATVAACVPPNASLRVRGAPPDAGVTIDEQYIGPFSYVAAHGVAMPAGKHRITIAKPGFFPWDRLVDAHGERIELDVSMTPIPE
jgi:hypothetical protein